jgi:PmbA protein
MSGNYRDIALNLLEKAKKKGATAGDIVLAEGETSFVQVRMGAVDKLSNAREKRLGIRLFFGQRAAVASTADFSDRSLDDLITTTCLLAKTTSEDPYAGLPDDASREWKAESRPDLDLCDPNLMSLPMKDRIEMARKAEAAALAADNLITNSEGSDLSMNNRRMLYANTSGFSGQYESSSISVSVTPIASANGSMQRDYWYCVKRKLAELDPPESIGREAARRTLRRLGARKIPTCSCPIVFDTETASDLLGNLSIAVNGYSIYKGASFLAGKLGQPIASQNVTVVDDGTIPSGLGTRPFDGEGLMTRKTTVIQNGILKNFLLDSYSGRKLKLSSTGNAARSIGDVPIVSPTNYFMEPGPYAPSDMIKTIKQGLYVTELIGFGVNLVTGDFSRGASGIWIENGELAYPVEGITIAGNLIDMLKRIEMIGNDLSFRSSINAPTLLIGQMTVAGD